MLRDLTIAESAKQRSLRVPLDYAKRPDRIGRRKWQAAGIAVCATAIYVAWLLAGGKSAQRHLSPGPVASVHAAWNDDCQACHQSFRPLRSDSVDLLSLASAGHDRRELLDAACIKCHNEP